MENNQNGGTVYIFYSILPGMSMLIPGGDCTIQYAHDIEYRHSSLITPLFNGSET